ncbi:hypothetical protein, partial [Rhizobium sp. Rhizsp42]|uniref:hypothetical protein n=1 Tax=Rhizobium sp. Rhizsp42 TaxID=3243034 RepID=UPI0039AF6D99
CPSIITRISLIRSLNGRGIFHATSCFNKAKPKASAVAPQGATRCFPVTWISALHDQGRK